MLLLLGSLIGSYLNIPIAVLPPEQVESDKVIEFFGMEYTVPMVQNLPGTVIALNVGGAVIPTIMSIYLLASRSLWVSGAIAIGIVALVLHWLATPVPGVGIAVVDSLEEDVFESQLLPAAQRVGTAGFEQILQMIFARDGHQFPAHLFSGSVERNG